MAVATQSNALTIDDVNETLENSLKDVFESDRFTDLLDVMSRVKEYSLNNQILIVAQNPESTMIMGFKEWQKLGRFVQKGEKAIKILAPVVNKMDMEKIDPISKKPVIDNTGNVVKEKKSVIRGFRTVSVFDVSQTEGKEIPSVRDFISRQMEDDSYVSKLYSDYKDYLVETKGLDIAEEETEKGVGGWYNRADEKIVISTNTNVNNTEKFRVLIHEYAHSLLHNEESEMKNLPRGHKEAQAESVAYVVSNYYGLDTSSVSTGYIATWSQDMKLAKQALAEIQEVANTIIDDVGHLQKEQIKGFYQDQTKDYEEAKKYLIEKVGISEKAFDPLEKTETQLQLINKENGYMLSGKLEYSERNQMFYLRSNRNLIEPLSDLSKDGKLAVLNVEKNLGQVNGISEYSRIPEHYSVKKLRNGPYVVQSASGQNIISKGFEKRGEAQEFQMRGSISQSLHQHTFFKKALNTKELQNELHEVTTEVERQINESVSQYLSHHSKKAVSLSNSSGISIGWTVLKNPTVKNIEQLKEFSSNNKHVPGYKQLPEEIEKLQEESVPKNQTKEIVQEHEIER
jgi:uncharacterized Zn finger protein (UPF0148 family)